MSPYTLEEIESRISRLSSPLDYDTEQALAFVADLTGEIRSSDPVVPLETIGRAIQYRPRFCEYANPHDGVCFAGSEQGEGLCSFNYSHNCPSAQRERQREVTLVHDWEEREAIGRAIQFRKEN